ncbi:MAG: hypothetical protein DRP09_15865 [Candidatus Thorarchaeota archaeon]|nr:MAG: hypothetical protein DRP09_15865 [Candidatus Thorarchaeota archaeon]
MSETRIQDMPFDLKAIRHVAKTARGDKLLDSIVLVYPHDDTVKGGKVVETDFAFVSYSVRDCMLKLLEAVDKMKTCENCICWTGTKCDLLDWKLIDPPYCDKDCLTNWQLKKQE